MAWYWILAWAVAHAIFLLDAYLELRGWTTISEWVWGKTPKSARWTWYAGAIVGFNLCFWVGSGPLGFAFLAGWLMAHLQGAK